jgi:hypothetical protein
VNLLIRVLVWVISCRLSVLEYPGSSWHSSMILPDSIHSSYSRLLAIYKYNSFSWSSISHDFTSSANWFTNETLCSISAYLQKCSQNSLAKYFAKFLDPDPNCAVCPFMLLLLTISFRKHSCMLNKKLFTISEELYFMISFISINSCPCAHRLNVSITDFFVFISKMCS